MRGTGVDSQSESPVRLDSWAEVVMLTGWSIRWQAIVCSLVREEVGCMSKARPLLRHNGITRPYMHDGRAQPACFLW